MTKHKIAYEESNTIELTEEKSKLNKIANSEKMAFVKSTIRQDTERIMLLMEAANEVNMYDEPKKMLDSLFEKLSALLDVDVYFNYVIDTAENKVRLLNYRGVTEKIASQIEWLELGEAVCGTVAKTEIRIISEDTQNSSNPLVSLIKPLGIKTYICHPLIAYGKLIGTLSFGSTKRTLFSSQEINLIEKICNQVAIALDRICLINELKLNNERLLKAKLEAEMANKAKSEFLQMMSHELRTPLNSILGFSQILIQDQRNPLSLKQAEKLEKIITGGNYLLSIINDILDISSLDFGHGSKEFKEIHVEETIADSIRLIKPLAEDKKIQIHTQLAPANSLSITGNARALKQILINLITNAIKYNHQNGEITIKTSVVSNSWLRIDVIDNGIGITEDEKKKIFEPFYRGKKVTDKIEGTGIGLAIVRKLVSEMNGIYGVESKLSLGSHFWVEFPLFSEK